MRKTACLALGWAGGYRRDRDGGFTLVEIVVALGLLGACCATLAHVLLAAGRANTAAHESTMAVVLASDKLEQLRAAGGALVQTDDASLSQNVPGTYDLFDARGRSLGDTRTARVGTAYVRRWSVRPLRASPETVWVLQVRVFREHGGAIAGSDRPSMAETTLLAIEPRTGQ